jgi:hypothetical protein
MLFKHDNENGDFEESIVKETAGLTSDKPG